MSIENLPGFDPFDLAQQDRHFEVMADLRARCPVARLDSGMIVVSRFDDVKGALNNPAMRNADAGRRPGVHVPEEDGLFFFEYDPPQHPALRRLVLDLLSAARAERWAQVIAALVEELMTPLLQDGGGEIVSQFSVPLAGRMMMRVAGFPEEDAPKWRTWIADMVTSGFSFSNQNERGTGYAECYPEVLEYLDRHLAAREAQPEADRPDDMVTRAITAKLDGEPLSQTIRRMLTLSVVAAGTNTLVNFVSNTLLSLARNPEVFDQLHEDPSRVPAAVEESLRRDSPSMYLSRVCARQAEVAGTTIEENERLLLDLASANRDETVYPEPEEFRLDRDDQPTHVAFGWGGHLCLGAPIARQVGVTMLETLVDLVDRFELEPGAVPMPYLSPQGNGLRELRLRLTPRRVPATASE